MTQDTPEKKSDKGSRNGDAPLALDDIHVEVGAESDAPDKVGGGSGEKQSLDQSINSVIRVEDDAVSSQLNESVCSVIRVPQSPENDAAAEEDKEGEAAKAGEDDEDNDQKIMNLTRAQFEVLISDLKTKHLAEKRMLMCDLSLCKKVVKQIISCMRSQAKER